MTILNENYRVEEGEFGTVVITVTGRCTPDEEAGIRDEVVTKYALTTIPNVKGAILKVLDGTVPRRVDVSPPTHDHSYRCVKVKAICRHFAPPQTSDMPEAGNAILFFSIVYQECGELRV